MERFGNWTHSLTLCTFIPRSLINFFGSERSSRNANYRNALEVLNLQSLDDRRGSLCLKFAKQCLQVKKFQTMFSKKRQVHSMKKRANEKFLMRRSLTGRHQKSAIPYMQRLLNRVEAEKSKICKQIDNFLPVNRGVLVLNLSVRSYIVGRVRLGMGANAQIGEK